MSPGTACKRVLLPLFLPYSLFIGCSVVGLVAGSMTSPSRPGHTTVRAGLDSLRPGTDVNLVLYNRQSFRGDFERLVIIPPKVYGRIYDTVTAKTNYARVIPVRGHAVTVVSATGVDSGAFAGVALGELMIRPANRPDTVGVPLEDVRWIQSGDSTRMEGSLFLRLVRNGTIPGQYLVVLTADHVVVDVGYETVDFVEVMPQSSGAMTGFLVGAAIDLTVVILAVASADRAESDCNSQATACNSNGASCGRHAR